VGAIAVITSVNGAQIKVIAKLGQINAVAQNAKIIRAGIPVIAR